MPWIFPLALVAIFLLAQLDRFFDWVHAAQSAISSASARSDSRKKTVLGSMILFSGRFKAAENVSAPFDKRAFSIPST
jgi:hypothetical protein